MTNSKKSGIDLFLRDISNHAHYNDFLELVGQHHPRVPKFDPYKENTDHWKHKSGFAEGYEFFASLMKINFEGRS
jgi:hypothetical protein